MNEKKKTRRKKEGRIKEKYGKSMRKKRWSRGEEK
jgi:hypothetical protein